MPRFNESSPTTTYSLTGNAFIDSILDPHAGKWSTVAGGKTLVSYSYPFLNGVDSRFTDDYGPEPANADTFGLTGEQAAGIDIAFQRWADVANIQFTRVTETARGVVGDIRVAFTGMDDGTLAYAYVPSEVGSWQADIWISSTSENNTFQPLTFDFVVVMHEIGHSLGLKHPFEGSPVLPAKFDKDSYTVMSYTSPKNSRNIDGTDDQQYLVSTLGVYDIAAVQAIYGANMEFQTGNNRYAFAPDQPIYESIWDAGGIDTFDVSAFTRSCSISLLPGTYSSLGYAIALDPNIGIAFDCSIENAIGGAGDDRIIGNDATNHLRGNGGKDTISGGNGNDVIQGGAGDDKLGGGAGNDTFAAGADAGNDSFSGGQGSDTATYLAAKAAVTVNLATGTARSTAAGDAAGVGTDTLTAIEAVIGSQFGDTLTGGAGNERFTGGLGDDRIMGGGGIDTASYNSAKAGVTVSLALTSAQNTGNAGVDTLSGIEHLTGSAFNDTLTGGSGSNRLDGGKGADSMTGGLGDDTYRIDNALDTVREDASAGRDTVVASVTFSLSANVEALTQTGTAAIDAVGNALANVLRGNGAANVLMGGEGTDQLFGGAGGDQLIGGTARDLLTGGAGADMFSFDEGEFGGLAPATCDLVADFSRTEGDRIDLSAVDADTLNGGGNDAFAFIGSDAFGLVAGQLRFTSTATMTVLEGDTNGDGNADFLLCLTGAPALMADDLVL